MALTVVSKKNTLQSCKSKYLVYGINSGVITEAELEREIARNNTTLTAVDIAAAMKALYQVIERLLENGSKVETPICLLSVCAHGKLDSDMDTFTPGAGDKGHRFGIAVRMNPKFRKEIIENLKWERAERFDETCPVITDVKTVYGTDGVYEAKQGECIRIKGRRLGFDVINEKIGIFFTDASGTDVRSDYFPVCEAATVVARIPDTLAPGKYKVKILTCPDPKKEAKKSVFDNEYEIKAK